MNWCRNNVSGKVYLEASDCTVIEKKAGLIMDWNLKDNETFTDFDDEYLFEEFGSSPHNMPRAFFAVAGILIICGIFENAMTCWILVRTKKYLRNQLSFTKFSHYRHYISDFGRSRSARRPAYCQERFHL